MNETPQIGLISLEALEFPDGVSVARGRFPEKSGKVIATFIS